MNFSCFTRMKDVIESSVLSGFNHLFLKFGRELAYPRNFTPLKSEIPI
jgi:hypothetical protein